MSPEIEAKMRLTDPAAIEQKLADLGGHHVATLVETNTYFDTQEHRLKSADQGLRIRVESLEDGSSRAIVTHKGPRAHGKLKSRTETEVGVEDARAAADLLKALGYLPVLSFEKRRRRWELDGCLVELDTLPYLGDFIEIEGPSDDTILAVRAKLGLADVPLIHASYIAMLTTYTREHHIRQDLIRLDEE